MRDRDWRPLSTAPHDGQDVELLFDDEETGVAHWQEEGRCCMLGPRAGAYPPGWTCTENGLPCGEEGEEILAWRPLEAAH